MVDRHLTAAKLAELADRIARIRAHGRPTVDALAADRDALELVSFNLMLAVQSCSDIASHLIADEGWRGQAIGLRNVVAHGYAGIAKQAP